MTTLPVFGRPQRVMNLRDYWVGEAQDFSRSLASSERELPNAKESQVALRRASAPTDTASWPELNEWFAQRIERWVEVLRPIVKTLEPQPDSGTLDLADSEGASDAPSAIPV